MQAYGTFEPVLLAATFPYDSVWESVTFTWEANLPTMMVAQATVEGGRFTTLRHPKTREYIVKDGEPFRPFDPRDKNTREFVVDGIAVKMKSTTRVRLHLIDFLVRNQLAEVELKSTAAYDGIQLKRQLNALQKFCQAHNGGTVAGVPLHIFRKKGRVVWQRQDGATVLEKWLLNIVPNPAWIGEKFGNLGKYAISPPSNPFEDQDDDVRVDEDFETEDDDSEISRQVKPPTLEKLAEKRSWRGARAAEPRVQVPANLHEKGWQGGAQHFPYTESPAPAPQAPAPQTPGEYKLGAWASNFSGRALQSVGRGFLERAAKGAFGAPAEEIAQIRAWLEANPTK